MPVPDGLTKVVTSGTLCGGTEKFAFSLWYEGYTEPPASGSIDLAGFYASSGWSTFLTAIKPLLTVNDHFTQLDAYWYSGGEAVAHTFYPISVAGTGGSGYMPNQVAMVLSLRTALATRRGRGRIYLPVKSIIIDPATGLMSGGTPNAAADALAAHFTTVGTSGTINPVVVSQTGSFSSPITSVTVDNVADTQRRRRNKIVGAVHSAPVT